jgi:aconitate hydratase
MYLGVKVVLAKTMERIHQANLVNFGILPLCFVDAADYDTIEAGDKLTLRDIHAQLGRGNSVVVLNETKNKEYRVRAELSPRQRDYVLSGGLLNHTTAQPGA